MGMTTREEALQRADQRLKEITASRIEREKRLGLHMTTKEETLELTMPKLLPSKPSQVRVMTIASGGDPHDLDAGHWYSPRAVKEMLDLVKKQTREECLSVIEYYKIPVGNSPAGEMACEWTYEALKAIRDAIRAMGD